MTSCSHLGAHMDRKDGGAKWLGDVRGRETPFPSVYFRGSHLCVAPLCGFYLKATGVFTGQ